MSVIKEPKAERDTKCAILIIEPNKAISMPTTRVKM